MLYSIVIPTLDEQENLKILLPQLVNPDCEVLVCDGGSTDGTVEVATSLGAKVLKGSGTVTDAIFRGMQAVQTSKIIVMDSDLSHPPKVVSAMVAALDEHDMVVGSRFLPGGSYTTSFKNRVITFLGNLVSKGLVPQVSDRMGGYFGIRTDKVIPIQNDFKPMLELLVKADLNSVAEVPYQFVEREVGKSKYGRPGSLIAYSLQKVLSLYLYKYQKFAKFGLVGGIGALLCLGFTALFTEVFGVWYLFSVVVGIIVASLWNFAGDYLWAFGDSKNLNDFWNLGHGNEDGDFDWWEWYGNHPVKRYWKRKMGSFIRELAGGPESVLSLGCGSSPVINMFHSRVIGVDINPEKIDFLREYTTAEVSVGDITKGIPDGKFDCILCNEVLEHLDSVDIGVVIRLIAGSTDRVVVSSPDYGIWYGRILENLFHGKFHHEFSFENLDKLFTGFGFERVESRRFLWDTAVLYERQAT